MNDIIRPRSSADTALYWEGCQRGELLFQQCATCNEVVFHPRALCPYCLADALQWKKSSGQAHIYSFTVQHIALRPNDLTYLPRIFGIAALNEGFHMFSEFLAEDLKSLRIGDPLEAVFVHVDDNLVLPKFRVLTR